MSLDPSTLNPLNGLKKFSVKFQDQTPATTDATTGTHTPASGPDHGLAEISLESHAPDKGGMTAEGGPNPQAFGGGAKLSPMEEALFPHWMRANGIDPDSTTDHTYDYKGAYQQSGGQVHPPGVLDGVASKINSLHAARPPAIQSMLDAHRQAESSQGQEDPLRSLLNMLGNRQG